MEEMKALKENDTWKIVNRPEEKKLVSCKWIFTLKVGPEGKIERYKA